jgi:hypothetical protein
MVVAVPRLLDLRGGVSDSAAKQQLNTVKVAVDNWFAERDTFDKLMEGTTPALQVRVPDVDIVDGSAGTGKGTSRALKVGVQASATEVVMVASNGETNCWGIKISKAGTQYAGKPNTEPGSCKASGAFSSSDWKSFEYPVLD